MRRMKFINNLIVGFVCIFMVSCTTTSRDMGNPPGDPQVPGSTYLGTDDLDVMKMLIFSSYKHVNVKFMKSMLVPEIQKNEIPKGGSVPGVLLPTGDPIVSIYQTYETFPNYIYPALPKGQKIYYLKAKFPKSKRGGCYISIVFPIAMINGKLMILRPVYMPPQKQKKIGVN